MEGRHISGLDLTGLSDTSTTDLDGVGATVVVQGVGKRVVRTFWDGIRKSIWDAV